MRECFGVTGSVATAVAIGDLTADEVWFGAVVLELGAHVVDVEVESADPAEFGPVGSRRFARVAVRFVGLHGRKLFGEVAADGRFVVDDGGRAVELDRRV